MKRYAVFAHYDKQGIIDDYVLYYLENLKKVCECIVFVSDGELNALQENKLTPYVQKIIAKKHGEYDFGSYKRGFFAIKEDLTQQDELIFCNDSCFGPLCEFSQIFETMNSKECDMWGALLDSRHEFLMSFFLLIKPTVFLKPYFSDFLQSVQKEKKKEEVVLKYEKRLSRLVLENNGKLLSYTKDNITKKNKINNEVYSDTVFNLLDIGFPFIKKLSFSKKDSSVSLKYRKYVKSIILQQYIENYIKRTISFKSTPFSVIFFRCFYKIKNFLYHNQVTQKKKRIIKICNISVYRRNVKDV